MAAPVGKILASAHADEAFEGFFENEWEPENKYVTALKEMRAFTPNPMFGVHPTLRPMMGPTYSPFVGPDANVIFVASSSKGALDWATSLQQPGEIAVPRPSIQVQIFNCIAARPHESIKLFSKLGIVTFVFVLLVYFVGGVLIVNPVFAFFGVLACGLFWTMAVVDKRLYHRQR